MAKINEIKEQRVVVQSVGDFANSLQQIAASRMAVLRRNVLASRRFVDEATVVLRELKLEQRKAKEKALKKVIKHYQSSTNRNAIIVISSNQGLCGSYNTEIFKKVDEIVPRFPTAEYFILGSKGQDYFRKLSRKQPDLKFYPYNIPEQVSIQDLRPLIGMFVRYDNIYLIYSKYINTLTRDVVFVELAVPPIPEEVLKNEKEQGKFIFEPTVDILVDSLSQKLRYALFRQQLLDSRLSLYSAQMIAMQTASDNAKDLLKELQIEYNKHRRKAIDKKIQEVQAGRSLWAD